MITGNIYREPNEQLTVHRFRKRNARNRARFMKPKFLFLTVTLTCLFMSARSGRADLMPLIKRGCVISERRVSTRAVDVILMKLKLGGV